MQGSENGQRPQIVLVAVEGKEIGSIEVETNDGQLVAEQVIALDLDCLVGETAESMPITLVIPVSAGWALIQSLLTEDQFDAALNA